MSEALSMKKFPLEVESLFASKVVLSTTTPALAVSTPPAAIVPDTSKLPFRSTVVAAI